MQTTSNTPDKRILTEQEISYYIGMSRSFLRQARMSGNRLNHTPAPPFIKIGRSVRYLREDLDDWLDQFQRLEHLQQVEVGGLAHA